jgi:deoxyuridine 5'-triphosphate nucleotidohydrolase
MLAQTADNTESIEVDTQIMPWDTTQYMEDYEGHTTSLAQYIDDDEEEEEEEEVAIPRSLFDRMLEIAKMQQTSDKESIRTITAALGKVGRPRKKQVEPYQANTSTTKATGEDPSNSAEVSEATDLTMPIQSKVTSNQTPHGEQTENIDKSIPANLDVEMGNGETDIQDTIYNTIKKVAEIARRTKRKDPLGDEGVAEIVEEILGATIRITARQMLGASPRIRTSFVKQLNQREIIGTQTAALANQEEIQEQTLQIARTDDRATIPKYNSIHEAGIDLKVLEPITIGPNCRTRVPTGLIAVAPPGTYLRIDSMDSLALERGIIVINSTIDPGYTEEIQVTIANITDRPYMLTAEETIAKLICEKFARPVIKEVECQTLEKKMNKKKLPTPLPPYAGLPRGCPMIKVIIQNYEVTVYLDNGSQDNIMHSQIAKDWNLMRFIEPTRVKMHVVGGSTEAHGKIKDLVVKVGPITTKETFIVMDNPNLPIILGRTYYDKLYAIQDYAFNTITFRQGHLKHVVTTYDDPNRNKRHKEPTVEPIRTSALVELSPEATIDQEFNIGETADFKTITEMLDQYPDLVCTDLKDVRRTKTTQHEIHLTNPNSPPINQKIDRVPVAQRKWLEEELEKMLKNKIINHSESPWSFRIILVPKKDGKTRICIDYRDLNELTIKNAYPLPKIDDLLDALNGAKIFTTLDLFSGYWQVPLSENAKPLTGFSSSMGHYQFEVMPFGLANAPATFQSMVNKILKEYLYKFALVYLDDIVIFSQTIEEHYEHIKLILKKLEEAELCINPNKCYFGYRSINYLGFVISDKGLETDPKKVDIIREWPEPRSVRQVQSFLGLCNYYRRFVESFSKIAKPLTEVIKGKEGKVKMNPGTLQSFNTLKNLLITAPILKLPNFDLEFILQTDASGTGIGAVLCQNHPGDPKESVVSYYSKKFSKSEAHYAAVHKEAMAVVYSIEHYRHFLLGRKFTVVTDHAPLRQYLRSQNPIGQHARWIEKLQFYQFDIVHKPGRLNIPPDVLSRLEEDHTSAALARKLAAKYEPYLQRIYDQLTGQKIQYKSIKDLKIFREQCKKYKVEKRTLYRVTKRTPQIVPSLRERSELVKTFHLNSAHSGITTTIRLIVKYFWWPKMNFDVRSELTKCHCCQLFERREEITEPLSISCNGLFENIALDFVGPMRETNCGNTYILVCTEYLSRWPIAVPLPTATGKVVAEFLYNHIFMMYGLPKVITTDRGTHFKNDLIFNICEILSVEHRLTSAYHPRANGRVERLNQTLIEKLQRLVVNDEDNWDLHLNKVLYSCRIAPNSDGKSPFEILYGIPPRVIEQADMELKWENPAEERTRYLNQHEYRDTRLYNELKKVDANKRVKSKFKLGDAIRVINTKPKKKFLERYLGPFIIIGKQSNATYIVYNQSTGVTLDNVHQDRMLSYHKDTGSDSPVRSY